MYKPGHYVTWNGKTRTAAEMKRAGFPREAAMVKYLDTLYAKLMDKSNDQTGTTQEQS